MLSQRYWGKVIRKFLKAEQPFTEDINDRIVRVKRVKVILGLGSCSPECVVSNSPGKKNNGSEDCLPSMGSF